MAVRVIRTQKFSTALINLIFESETHGQLVICHMAISEALKKNQLSYDQYSTLYGIYLKRWGQLFND